jgi:transposase InsO family protein
MWTDFVLDALEQVLYARQPERNGLVHHGDRGSQYVSIKYSERLAEAGIEPSVGSKGDSYDNALAETINGPLRLMPDARMPSPRARNAPTGLAHCARRFTVVR